MQCLKNWQRKSDYMRSCGGDCIQSLVCVCNWSYHREGIQKDNCDKLSWMSLLFLDLHLDFIVIMINAKS